jgi:DNA polymerase-3 subunit epsilon
MTRWLVNPGVPVPQTAIAVHGLTDDRPQRDGRRPAPVLEEVARALAVQAAKSTPLVVMNAPFDLTLLDRELRRHRAASLADYVGCTSLCVLDPRVLDTHLDRRRAGGRTLADLCAHYGVELTGTRDAAADALAAIGVVRAVGRRYAGRLERLSAAELHSLQAVWHAAQARGLQAWFERSSSGEAVDPAWPLRLSPAA